jgi:hypothetical protein
MENLVIEETSSTPSVNFSLDGKLLIEGRSLPENVNQFYIPLEKWITKLNAKKVIFDINLEYFNSATAMKIYDMLKLLDNNDNIKNIIVNWHYEEGDDDNFEAGQVFEELLSRGEFNYIECSEAA